MIRQVKPDFSFTGDIANDSEEIHQHSNTVRFMGSMC